MELARVASNGFTIGSMIKSISTNSLRHLITCILTASVVASFGPALFQRAMGWYPADSTWLQVGANYGFGLIVMVSFAAIVAVVGWGGIREILGDKLVVLSIASVLISVVVNMAYPRPMLFFLPPSLFLMFTIIPKYKIYPDERPAVAILLLLVITPIIVDILLGPSPGNYLSASFRGYLQSRTDYAFICALTLVALLRSSSAFSVLSILFVSVGIAFSGSRAAYLSAFVSLVFLSYFFIFEKKYRKLIAVVLAITAITLSPSVFLLGDFWKDVGQVRLVNVVGVRSYEHTPSVENVGILFDTLDRMAIYRRALEEAVQNFWFGKGDYFQQVHINAIDVEAHNNLLQTVLNFGIFAALCWAILILRLFFRVSEYGRAIILAWLCFGLFQPGYDAFLFTPANFMVLLFSYVLVEREPIFASSAKEQVGV